MADTARARPAAIVRGAAAYALGLAAVLLLWHLLAVGISSPVLPTPAETIPVLAAFLPEIAPAFAVSLSRVTAALILSCVFALPAGLALGRAPRAYAIAAPVLHILYPIPKVVLLPVLLVLLGLGDAAKVALMAITAFFQVLVGVRDAAAAVSADAVDAAASLGAGRWVTMRHVIVPAVLPELFTALRQGMGTCVAILFLSEAIAGSTGLGYFIVDAWGMLDYPRMFAGIVGMGVLGAGLYELMVGVEWVLTPWRRAGRGAATRPGREARGRC